MMERKTIALVIKTEGLEYDDRVRKEILSVQQLCPEVSFKIFAMLPGNREEEGVTDYGVPYKSLYIPAREKYPSAKKTTLKAFQFYKVVKKEVRDFDAVWVANVDAAFVPMLLKHRRILWDLHELPLQFTGNTLTRKLLRYVFNRCKVVLHANPQREQYLESIGVVKDPAKQFSLRNYPNFEESDKEYDGKYNSFVNWKRDRKCVYLQGLNMDRRAPFESISAVLATPELCAVVIGGFDAQIKQRLVDTFGEELNERVLFVGKIPQLKIPQYMKQCYLSLVFYKNVNANNYYCEANRFYQASIMELPVVVGNNPPMKELVNLLGLGVSIDDDGSKVDMIIKGIDAIVNNYEQYHQNAIKNRNCLLWNKQDATIINIVKKLFQ